MYRRFLLFFAITLILHPNNHQVLTKVTEDIKRQCLEEHTLIDTNTDTNRMQIPVDNLCYTRCLFVKGGYLNPTNGRINIEQMRTDRIIKSDEKRLNQIYNCIKNLATISTCEQITGLIQCFSL